MENKEFEFKGTVFSGFLVISLLIILVGGFIALAISNLWFAPFLNVVIGICILLLLSGFVINEPNNARVFVFFGKYSGVFKKTGFFWVNPFYQKKKVTLRARNLDVPPIKVNDKAGNPIMIGMVLIWKVSDTYKAIFDIDSSSFIETNPNNNNAAITFERGVAKLMRSLENFVSIQGDAALREVAGKYGYDSNEALSPDEETLRSGGEKVNLHLEKELNERLKMAGIEIIEARINNLAYAPEIAAVMLRRQQAAAIIAAREKIVEGAVSMVDLALRKLSEDNIVTLDEDKKAAMVSNLLVVLCADESAHPVINAGTLYH